MRGDGLQRCRQMLCRSRPLSECAVGAAIHSHTAIAPGLLGDPIDDRPRVIAIMPERDDLTPAPALAARECHYSHVTVSSALLREGARVDIDRELQERGQRLGV